MSAASGLAVAQGATAAARTNADTVQKILGNAVAAGRSAVSSASSYASSSLASYSGQGQGQDSPNYALQVLFYLLMYAFVLFLVLLLVHFTVRPIFRFTPGANGLIGLPSAADDKVYWNTRSQPALLSYAPLTTDTLAPYAFTNNFTMSVDLYVRRMTDTNAKTRVILYKTHESTSATDPLATGPTATEDISAYMAKKVSMFVYLTSTNDIGVTFYTGLTGTPYSSREIKNIPLYTPFRLTIVVEDKTFSVYINAQQAFQRTVPSAITLNSSNSLDTKTQRFYPPPAWADSTTKTVFLQNLHLWPRSISYPEVQRAQPALALAADFDMPVESGTSSCS
jgi:hypothetical protein